MNKLPLIFACSHHRKGNSDYAAKLFLKGITEAGGRAELIFLGDYDFRPCIGCLSCRKNHKCIFHKEDHVEEFCTKILKAPFVYFSSPIYFYHLPSRLKTFIDRTQFVYEKYYAQDPEILNKPVTKAYSTLIAGRPTGEKLFEGSELTLKFFLKFFNVEHHKSHNFKGLDASKDLQNSKEKCQQIIDLGKEAWRRSQNNE